MARWKEFLESTAGAITLLFGGLALFSIVCIMCAVILPSNERIAVLFSGIVGNFSGALFTVITVHNRITPKDPPVDQK